MTEHSRRSCRELGGHTWLELPSEPGQPPRIARWEGRTGVGQIIRLVEAGDWLEIVYYEHDGETVRGGFALNPLYGAEFAIAAVQAIARRATR